MHIVHGNTKSSNDQLICLRICNIAGLQKDGRSEFLADNTVDFMALSETHANIYTQQSFTREMKEHTIIFGEPVSDRGFAGVAFMYKKSSAWAVKKLSFLSNKCRQFYNDSRLLCVQIFRSDEKRSVILYIIYGKSGARWEPSKRDYNRQMLSAIHEDSVLRGDLATIICGDFNLTVEDATDVFNLYKKSRWVDAALFGNTGFDDRPTSMKGHGARIDMALLNHTAASLPCQYDLMDGINTEDHRILDIKMHVPCAAQHWYMPKRCANAKYQYPSSGYEPPQIERDKRIQQHLAKNNLEDAYKQWSLNAENLLATIPTTDKTVSFSHGRGRTAWRRLTVYPPEGFADTDTVWCRQLAKALRQVEELVRMQVWVHRADNTYSNLRKFIIREQNNFTTGVLQLVPEKINRQTLEPLQSLISQEYKQAKRDCGQKRLKAWKARLQSSEKQWYKWVQGWAKVETLPMKRSDGRYTIDRTQQLQEILNEWIPIFQKFKQEKPQVQTFIEHFGPNMRYQDMSL